MIIDVSFVDILIVLSSSLSVLLRASRHLSTAKLPAPIAATTTDGPSGVATGTSLSSSSNQPSTVEIVMKDDVLAIGSTQEHASGKESNVPRKRSSRSASQFVRQWVISSMSGPAVSSVMTKKAILGPVVDFFFDQPVPTVLHKLAYTGNILALISNCLTHLLRHSQVLYAVFLTTCDALIIGREQPQYRFMYICSLVVLLCMLYVCHEETRFFWVGDFCGYVGGLLQLFLLGAVFASPATATTFGASSVSHGVGSTVVAEFTLERCAAVVSSMCYFAMLLDEGEAVYRSHQEFVRWYGSTVAMMLNDGIQLMRIVKFGCEFSSRGDNSLVSGLL